MTTVGLPDSANAPAWTSTGAPSHHRVRYNALVMWHQVTLAGDSLDAPLEQMRMMNVLGSSLMKMNLEVAQRIGALRSAGLPVDFTTVQVEIYVDRDKGKLIWLLNDAAIEVCRRLGENMQAEASFGELPKPPEGLLARSRLLHAPLYSITT